MNGSSRSAAWIRALRAAKARREVRYPRGDGTSARARQAGEDSWRWPNSRKPFHRRWQTVVCIASGPSLTAGDCEFVRRWRNETKTRTPEETRGVIVTNTTFRLCPWADGLFAMDAAWWKYHMPEVSEVFEGERLAPGQRNGITRVRSSYYGRQGQNSGAGAIAAAHSFGASRVVLLGYDCQYTGGKRHWHGDHPKGGGSGNAGSVKNWPAQFRDLLRHVPGLEIINCSRATALTVFPRANLEDVLA